MSDMFIAGIVVSIISGLIVLAMYIYAIRENSGGNLYKGDYQRIGITTIILAIISWFFLLYGYYGYCLEPTFIENDDGKTMIVIERSMSGKERTLKNVKVPIVTYGTVTRMQRKSRYVGVPGKGGHQQTYYIAHINLDDGREITQRTSRYRTGEGKRMAYHEKFYPRYSTRCEFYK